MSEYRKKIKKELNDICNICGNYKELTWEHVPPKSCGNTGNFKINRIYDVDEINEKLDSQNGIKYRTICKKCNNEILGANADLAFEEFYKQVKSFSEIVNSPRDECVIKINLVQVLKCLFGKMLAMDNVYYDDKISMAMRNFILENKIDKTHLHVYFWIYPYNTSIQARLHVSKQVCGDFYNTNGLISLLYFYPVAFIVSRDKEELMMTNLIDYVDFDNQIIDLKISPIGSFNPKTGKTLPFNFLDVVDDEHIILTNKDNNNKIAIKKTTN